MKICTVIVRYRNILFRSYINKCIAVFFIGTTCISSAVVGRWAPTRRGKIIELINASAFVLEYVNETKSMTPSNTTLSCALIRRLLL